MGRLKNRLLAVLTETHDATSDVRAYPARAIYVALHNRTNPDGVAGPGLRHCAAADAGIGAAVGGSALYAASSTRQSDERVLAANRLAQRSVYCATTLQAMMLSRMTGGVLLIGVGGFILMAGSSLLAWRCSSPAFRPSPARIDHALSVSINILWTL